MNSTGINRRAAYATAGQGGNAQVNCVIAHLFPSPEHPQTYLSFFLQV